MALIMVAFFLATAYFWKTEYLGGLVVIGAIGIMSVGRSLYTGPSGLIPALNSYWLKIHVTSMVTASALLSFTFFFSFAALLKAWAIGGRKLVLASGPRYSLAATVTTSGGTASAAGPGAAVAAAGPRWLQTATAWLPDPETLDKLAFRMVLIGFPLWTFGVMMGAVWGEHAWGRWWGNDPKEIMAACDLDHLRHLFPRPRHWRYAGLPDYRDREPRVPVGPGHLLLRQPLDRRPPLLRQVGAPGPG